MQRYLRRSRRRGVWEPWENHADIWRRGKRIALQRIRLMVPLGAVLLSAFIVVVPVWAEVHGPTDTWFTFAATAQGNYPGGKVQFSVFAVNSALTPTQNESIDSMTVSTPWGNISATGLPAVLTPQESLSIPIYAQIPSSFNERSFTAQFLAHTRTWNGTSWVPLTHNANVTVDVLALPPCSSVPALQPCSSASQGASTISTTVLALGVGIPSGVAVVLLGLLIRSGNARRR